ncbi:MAG: multidrug effflux MFS transporter [Zoogloeaceae bacterium]|jgi:DHA1 family bicyclomycin/chloramphenicol resistance-like MFS transporter|nr:multidrug effflux MFS transporter [Zoogloeaceae bacterium]
MNFRDEQRRWILPLVLAALSAVGPFSIDAYLPAFQEMGQTLRANPVEIQQTLSIYMLMFGLMTLWHGALSDSFGRKRVILLSLMVYALASLGCALSVNIEMLWVMRAAQGVSAGAGMVVSRAIVRDLYDGAQAQRLMANIAVMFAIAPATAPIVGGWILYFFGWRGIFVFLTLATIGLYALCWRFLPESLPKEKRQAFAVGLLLKRYRSVLFCREFLALSLGLGVVFCGSFIYVLAAPVFIREHLRLGETDFYWLFVPGMFGMIGGSWFSGRVAGAWNLRRTLCLAFGVMAAAVCLNLAASGIFPQIRFLAVLPMAIYSFGVAFSMPALTLLALDFFPENRGLAASCQSFVQTLFAALCAAVVVPWLWHSRVSLALGMLGMWAAGFLLVYLAVSGSRGSRKR